MLPLDEHNRRLLACVQPADWKNPTPAARYNLVVIGAGTAGLIAASGAAGLGARVALVERGLLGGDCLNVGCVPSKALLRCARAAAAVRDAGVLGIRVPPGVAADFPAIMERMRRLRAGIAPHDSAARYRDMGVDVFLGQADFIGQDAVRAAGQTLRLARAVIATGARAVQPDIPGLKEAGFLTNENVFELTELPRRLAVLGGGPIGCELAQAMARFGSQVTLVQRSARILPRDDPAAAMLVADAMRRDGVQIMLHSQLQRVELRGGEKVLHLEESPEDGPQKTSELVVDAILAGAGRAPNVQGLGLEAAGITYDERTGVHVNDRLRTANPRVYAAGDVCSQFQFTHAADALARIAIQNSLFYGRAKVSELCIPWCTYTDPELAHIGLTEVQAREQGLAVQVFEQPLSSVDRAVLDGQTNGFVKVLVKAGTDRIVGATIVASHAGDLIAEISLAMTLRAGLGTLSRTIHPYPTQAEAVKRVADAYNRTRLTPWLKRLFQQWFAWTR